MADAFPDRYCARGNHMRPRSQFRFVAGAKLARDCLFCEKARKQRTVLAGFLKRREAARKAEDRRFPGVDIDAIHYKLGAVRKRHG